MSNNSSSSSSSARITRSAARRGDAFTSSPASPATYPGKRSRSPPPSPLPLSSFSFSSSSSSCSFTPRPSNDFARLLADARDHHGTIYHGTALFADATTLDAMSRCADSSSGVLREGELLLTGGYEHDCSFLSPRTGHWRDGPSMPTKRAGHLLCSAGRPVGCVRGGGDGEGVALSSTLLLPAGDRLRNGREVVAWQLLAVSLEVRSLLRVPHRMLVVLG